MAHRNLFVNLPVRDLPRAKTFFASIGWTFNPQFTNDQGACMVLHDNLFAMLLTEPFFAGFTPKRIADAREVAEVLVCLSCDSRDEVDALLGRALAAGASEPKPPQDHGFMYGRTFLDLDGHQWELMWMDPGHVMAQE